MRGTHIRSFAENVTGQLEIATSSIYSRKQAAITDRNKAESVRRNNTIQRVHLYAFDKELSYTRSYVPKKSGTPSESHKANKE